MIGLLTPGPLTVPCHCFQWLEPRKKPVVLFGPMGVHILDYERVLDSPDFANNRH